MTKRTLWESEHWSKVVLQHGTIVQYAAGTQTLAAGFTPFEVDIPFRSLCDSLTEQQRFEQRADLELLDWVRINNLLAEDITRLEQLSSNDVSALEPVHLFPERAEVRAFHDELFTTSFPR
eukprot:1471934-Prymnesium_polylepis.1